MFPATHGEQAAAAAAGQEGGLIHKHLGSSVLRSYSKSPQRNVPQRTSAENSLAGSTQFGTPCFTIAATIKVGQRFCFTACMCMPNPCAYALVLAL